MIFLFFTLSSFAQKSSTIFDVARTGTVAEAKALFEQNPKVVDEINEAGYSPLILACYRGNTEVAQFLIENGANLNYNSTMGTPLMAAVVKGNIEIVKTLLDLKADVNLSDANGISALIYAVQFQNPEILSMLLHYKADKSHQDKEGKTAFEHAVFSGNETIINLLK
ncbi:ankyrin repeat domain-containing protein [Flavobacterium sp.]|uniref:ankyrin repeat domain-containing protein n=1 Tax=Flavobacterium sp. TaxID=239 RepID=UPI0037C129D8